MTTMHEAYDEACRVFLELCDLDEEERAKRLAELGSLTDEVRAQLDLLLAHDVADDFLEATVIDTAAVPPEGMHEALPDIARYEIIRTLDSGGMGVVYLAHQLEPVRREVAIKVMHLDPMIRADPARHRAHLARFDVEQQTLALMSHADIARILDGGHTADGRPFLVMDYVPGVPITAFCRDHDLTIDDRLHLFQRVCAAVEHAHLKGIIHRDLKPSNVLAWMDDEGPHVKVIDFGIAKLTAVPDGTPRDLTRPGVLGTPAYMSPEQTTGAGDVDRRTDVYALGCILYELLVGRAPLRDRLDACEHDLDRLRVITDVDPDRPSTAIRKIHPDGTLTRTRADVEKLRRRLESEIDWIVLKALSKEPQRRYPTAAALADDVDRHLRNDSVVAAPPTRTYRLRKFARRNKGVLATGSVIAMALVVAMVVSTSFAMREAAAHQAADQHAKRSERITEFLRETLSAPSLRSASLHDGPTGRHIRVLDVLSNISDETLIAFAEDPRTEIQVRLLVGEILSDYGEYGPARDSLERALLLLAREAEEEEEADAEDEEHAVDRARAHLLLGEVHTSVAAHVEGETHLRRAADLAAAAGDRDLAFRARCLIGANLVQQRRPADAIDVLSHLRAELRDSDDAAFRAAAAHQLAIARYVAGAHEEAERLIKRVIDDVESLSGHEANATFLEASANYGVMLQNAGRSDEALELQRRVDASMRELYGPRHLAVAATTVNVADALKDLGRMDEAEPLLREAIAIRAAQLPEDAFDLAQAREKLSFCLFRLGRGEEARAPMRDAVPGYETLDDDDSRKALFYDNLAKTMYYTGVFAEAEAAALRSYDLRRRREDPCGDACLQLLRTAGLSRFHAGNADDLAAAHFERLLDCFVHEWAARSVQGMVDRLYLVATHLHRGKPAPALALVEDAIALLEPSEDARLEAWRSIRAALATGDLENALRAVEARIQAP